jgi:thiamine-phosphate pyrophosphorylase
MPKINDYSLYLVISEEYGMGKSPVEIAGLAISGGVDIIQMREKNKTRDELVRIACKLSMLCREKRVAFIVNDDPLIARESSADGVHLGQEDIQKYSISETRKIMGKDRIIGVSTHSLSQVKKADKQNIDYMSYGPVFPTKTKDYFLGTGEVKEVLGIAKKPVVFIGGINLSNLDELLSQGARNIGVIRGIIEAEDIMVRARRLKDILIREKESRG